MRAKHYKPILLVFVLSGIATFISFKIINLEQVLGDYYTTQELDSAFMSQYLTVLSNYYGLLSLCFIPVFALCTWLAFKKWGHNYLEHIIVNAYILSFYTLVSILIAYPIMFIFRNDAETIIPISMLSNIVIPVILIWFFNEFYADKSLKSNVIKVLITLVWLILVMLFLLLIFVVVVSILAILSPEMNEYLIPQR